jgi:hypothetical protein
VHPKQSAMMRYRFGVFDFEPGPSGKRASTGNSGGFVVSSA